jgi:hypothetical protein
VATSDFIVVFNKGIKKTSFVHLAGAVFSFAYGAWLLGFQGIVLN